ncbi:hypothetical protein D3C71_1917720 [compost metagenome]
MRDTTNVPELNEDLTTRFVNLVGHSLPASDLFWRENARREEIALTLLGYLRPFCDEQTCTGALAIIGRGAGIGHSVLGSRPGHWRHYDARG